MSLQAFEHEADNGEAHEGESGARITFKLPRDSSIGADPCERSLHNPALGHYDKTMGVGALNDLDLPASCRAHYTIQRHRDGLTGPVHFSPPSKGDQSRLSGTLWLRCL